MQLDDWVLCRIRHKSDTSTKFTSNDSISSSSYSDPADTFEEKDITEKINYFHGSNFAPKAEVLNEYGHVNFQEARSEDYITDRNFNTPPSMEDDFSVTDALANIRRVLSVGNFDEEMLLIPNKSQYYSFTPGDSDNSGIFDPNSPNSWSYTNNHQK